MLLWIKSGLPKKSYVCVCVCLWKWVFYLQVLLASELLSWAEDLWMLRIASEWVWTDLYLELVFRCGYIPYISVHPVHSSITDINYILGVFLNASLSRGKDVLHLPYKCFHLCSNFSWESSIRTFRNINELGCKMPLCKLTSYCLMASLVHRVTNWGRRTI